MNAIEKVFALGLSYININSYENELHLVELIHKKQDRNDCQSLYYMVLQSFDEVATNKEDVDSRVIKSVKLRLEGNKIRCEKGENNIVAVIRTYTEAIFAAPPGEVLALAHANRCVALQDFGYYQQAYDDCVVALEEGYPENLKNKVLLRQAYCAWKIGNLEIMKRHLDELEQRELNTNLTPQFEQLSLELKKMQENKTTECSNSEQSKEHNIMQDLPDIVHTAGHTGHCLVSNRKIDKNEIIFVERAPSIVKADKRAICENCATLLFVPFPCKGCSNRVVYCSLKCLREHRAVHEIECNATRLNMFFLNDAFHLALRMMVDGLPQILPYLKKQQNLKKVWKDLISGTAIKTYYGYTLQMETHFDKLPIEDVLKNAQIADFLLLYLKENTSFMDRLISVNFDMEQKELLVCSLLLRHIGQVKVNGFVLMSIVPNRSKSPFALLDEFWCRPFHVKRGKLHSFSSCQRISMMTFPYMNIANTASEPSFTYRFSGRYLNAYAMKSIEPGDEITCSNMKCDLLKSNNGYTTMFQQHFPFECLSAKCDCDFFAQDFDDFHQFRCERETCRKIFVAKRLDIEGEILCECGHKQDKSWYNNFNTLLDNLDSTSERLNLFDHFYALDRWLINFNIHKLFIAKTIIVECFRVLDGEVIFTDDEYTILGNIIRFYLDCIEQLNVVSSIIYVADMLYLWDLIALGKYKCTKDCAQKMLQALEIVSDDIKIMCMNYFDDYIRPQLN